MPFPNVGHLKEGDEWTHPFTHQLYKVGPNGVMQKFSKVLDLDQTFVLKTEFDQVTEDAGKSIENLENKVEALEGTVIDGVWELESRSTPRIGGFDLSKNGSNVSDWDCDVLRLHKTDSKGIQHTFAAIAVGDVIRLGGIGASAVYSVTSVTDSTGQELQSFEVDLLNQMGTPIPGVKFDFEFLPSFDPSAFATKSYTDNQDDLRVRKSGDEMSGNLTFTKGVGTVWHDNAGQNMGTLHRASSNTVQYTASNGKAFKITGKDPGGNAKTFIDVQNSDSTGTEGTDYALRLYHVASPTSDYHGVNRKYVDDKCKDIEDKIASPIRTWKYKSGGGNPGAGQFTGSGENYIRIHHTTHKGMDLTYSSGFYEDLNDGSTHFAKIAFTAWKHENGKAQGKFFIWAGWFNDTSNYFEIKDLSSTDKTDLGLEGTKEYELHLAGFF